VIVDSSNGEKDQLNVREKLKKEIYDIQHYSCWRHTLLYS